MKKFYSNLKSLFFLTALLLVSTNAWGIKTYTVKVGVGVGKGKAKVELWESPLWGDSRVAYTDYVSQGGGTKSTYSYFANTTDAYAKYIAEAAKGYKFGGWHEKDATCKNVASGTTSTWSTGKKRNKNYTFEYYARFDALEYTITFDKQSGTGGTDEAKVHFDNDDFSVKPVAIPSKQGYTFLGYYTATSGGLQIVNGSGIWQSSKTNYLDANGKWVKDDDVTLYAQWQENTYTVTWPTIESGLTYTPGEIVQNHWSGGSAVDGSTAVAGTFTCNEELQPAKNTTGYTVTFTPSNTDKYLPKQGNVKQDVAKADQYITWDLLDGKNPKDQYYEYATGEAFGATSYRLNTTTATGLAITYTSSDNSIATVDGNLLNVHAVNQVVTITATCVDANGNWNDATPVSKTFKTCGAKPDNWWAVKGENLTYGQFLSESDLTGAVKIGDVTVAGELSWVEPNTFPSAGSNQTFDVLFTPDNQEAYGSVTFPVTINVAKANPSFDWNIGTSLRAESQYNNFVSTNNAEASFTITTSSNSLLGVTGTKLTTGSVTNATTGWIRVSLPETDNFNALPQQQLNVTVNPKSNVCLPITTMNSDIYDQTFAGGSDDASWTNEGLLGIGMKYYVLYTIFYTRRTGIQLGDWTEGLSGADFDMEKYSDKYVVLAFNGSPKDISFDVETQYVYVVKSSGIGLGLTFPYPATYTNWHLYESPDGTNFTQVGNKFNSSSTEDESSTHINRSLKADTRYVKILYSGNFAGWVKNLQITKRDGYLTADQNSLTFGTNEHPLQDPQAVTISYGALGSCGQTGAITASIDNPHFYLDETSITDNVGFDYNGEYTVRVRCNEIGQTGTLTFEAFNGTKKTVSLTSTTPELTSAGSTIFQTGTEHAQVDASAYRTLSTIDYTKCFDGSVAKFDTLYLYGVTESSASERIWADDVVKGYKVPALKVAEGNLYTPCFVYAKKNNKYEYVRTCDATKTLNVTAAGEKLGFIGYRPASLTTTVPAIQLNGAAGEQTEVYLDNTEIVSNSVVLKTNSSSDAEPFEVKLYAHGTNILSANGATVQMNDAKTKLTIEDNWAALNSGLIALRHTAGYPSIDLAGANNVTINGSKVELHNATNMAIAHMSGATELTDGSVIINDGTILGDAILGMPQSTLIDGGTFNSGNVVCYNSKGKVVRPFNSNGDILSRQTMSYDDLVTNYGSWYGHSHLTLDGANVYPMLFGGEGLCIFEATIDDQSDKPTNWTTAPEETSDAIIAEDMEVNGSLTINSMTINEGVTVTVKNGATLIVGDGDSFRETAGNLHVENGGKVQLTTGELIVKDFILDAELGITEMNSTSASASGQVKNENKLRAYGDAYFRLKLDPSGRNTLGWYDFVVPFEVDVIGGISIAEDPDAQMKFNVNYAVMSYSESKRAVNGKDWNKFQGTMQPGRVYTIGLDDDYDWNTVVFKKKAGAALTGNRSFTTEYSGLGADVDNGWNGFGNGTLHHTELDVPDGTLIQLYDHSNRCYQPREAKDYTIAVGLSFFMQFDGVETVELANAEGNSQFRAPAHYARTTDKFRLALTAEGEEFAADNMWVSANEDATGEYVIGRDVLKMGTMNESKVARMWSERNGIRLCSNEMVLNNSYAVCDLTLYAPKAQQYTLSVEKAPEDAMLYLTYEGRAIWNLSYSPYVFDLTKGTTEGYGLKLYANPAPQVATGVDELDAEAQTMRKVMIDNVLYIITPDGAMYDVTGKSIK